MPSPSTQLKTPLQQTPLQTQQAPDLSQLKDIHLPPAISEFPIAYGWWLSLFILIALTATAVYFFIKQRNKTAIQRSALRVLNQHHEEFNQNQDSKLFLQQCNSVLKRYCITHYPHAVSLSGPNWANFLICYSQKTRFSDELITALSEGLYQPQCQYNTDELYQACVSWLKNNKPFVIDSEQGTQHD
jgi:hypothetical protein